ncbi:MAG TPA: DegV family protein [Dehalococcoidia bacterium]|nr:DegV family protein [Dehalococcoidia bacterium]
MLRIVTDSTADFDAEEADELGVTVVPLTVFFGEAALLDRVDIQPDEFYARLKRDKVTPRTSQPSAGRFQEVYADLAAAGATEILSIHISAKLSGTHNSARLGAGVAPAGCQIETLDSATVCGGLQAMVRRAAEIARDGGSLNQALEAARELVPHHRISIMLDTLEYLQKGGRIGRARALLGSLLNLKPIVHVEDGEVAPGDRVRSRARGIERIFQLTNEVPAAERIIVQHTGAANDAETLARRFRAAQPGVPVDVRWIGPVVGTYVGPNAVGAVVAQRMSGAI